MRIEYSDEEDFPGQFHLFQANCARSLEGRAGQAVLRELEEALVALPAKRLIANDLDNGADCCAIGAVVRRRGLDPSQFDPEFMEDVGVKLGMPRLVAWKIVEWNDIDGESYDVRAPGPNLYHYPEYTPGYRLRVAMTPEERYNMVLRYVRELLAEVAAA